jgi:hypothetical protein
MYWRFIIRFLLLSLGFALTTSGLLAWQQINFDLSNVWPISGAFDTHPVYAIVIGLALIPPTLWEIFVLEHGNAVHSHNSNDSDGKQRHGS